MNWIILIAGVTGLACAAYALVTLSIGAWKRRRYPDIAIAVCVAAVTVVLLIAFGDRIIR